MYQSCPKFKENNKPSDGFDSAKPEFLMTAAQHIYIIIYT
jgi:hypothetical protein